MAVSARNAFHAVALALALIALLYWTQPVLKPIALAALLALILNPAVRALERRNVKRILATALVACTALITLAGMVAAVTQQLVNLASDMGDYEQALREKLADVGQSDTLFSKAAGLAHDALGTVNNLLSSGPPTAEVVIVEGPLGQLQSALTPWAAAAGTAGVVIVLCIFFLLRRDDLSDRVIKLAGQQRIGVTTRTLDEAAHRISRYLSVFAGINLAYGVGIAAGLSLIGLPFALLWGAIAAIMRFIPYIGVAIGFVGPVVLALVVFDGWEQLLLIVLLFGSLEVILVGAVEPVVYGRSTGVSPVALMVFALFWTWLWGPLGLLLSTPLTVSLAVAGKYVPGLSGMGTLLGDSPNLPPHLRLYHRLLAADVGEARAMAERAIASGGLEHALDRLIRPALSAAAREAALQTISARERSQLWRAFDDLIDEMEWKREVYPNTWAPDRELPAQTLLAVARDETELLLMRMLNLLLEGWGCCLTLTSEATLRGLEDRLSGAAIQVLVVIRTEGDPEALTMRRRLRLSPHTPVVTVETGTSDRGVTGDAQPNALAHARDELLTLTQSDDVVRNDFRRTLEGADEAGAQRLFDRLLRTHAFDRLHLQVVAPLLSGDAQIGPEALVRLRTLLAHALRERATAVRAATQGAGRVLVACPGARSDDVDLLLLTLTLKARGADVLYLGNALPAGELARVAREMQPEVAVVGGHLNAAVAATLDFLPVLFIADQAARIPDGARRLPAATGEALQAIESALAHRAPAITGANLNHSAT